MMRKVLAICCVALLPFTASAATWGVVPDKSRLGFSGTQGGTAFKGTFHKWSANIVFDPAALNEAKVDVTIDMTSAESGSSDRDSALKQPEWFHVKTYPAAKFTASKFRHVGDDRYEADGTLTIKDKTHPVTLPFTVKITGNTAQMSGTLTLKRHDFTVGDPKLPVDQWIGKTVDVTMTVIATRK